MKYVIRKVPERNTAYLERLLPDALIYNDTGRIGALWSFHEAMRLADDDAVYIQDDMFLCKDFRKRAEEYIRKYKDEIVVFSNHTNTREINIREEGFWEPKKACWLLCTYIPRAFAREYLDDVDSGRWKIERKRLQGQYDDLNLQDYLKSKGRDVFLTVPNLAGHPANISSINKYRPIRITDNFDYENMEPRLDGEQQRECQGTDIYSGNLNPQYLRRRQNELR